MVTGAGLSASPVQISDSSQILFDSDGVASSVPVVGADGEMYTTKLEWG